MASGSPKRHIGEVVLGRYLIDRLVGEGAFAWVYHGRTKTGEELAVKVLHSGSEAAALRLARETSVLKALPPSPFVPRYVDQGWTRGGEPLMVLEYVDGITLREGMERLPQPPARMAVTFVAELCQAFAGLHQLGVAHRDVKPANVLIARAGGVKLIDFGVIRDAQGILKLLEGEQGDGLPYRVFHEELDAGVLVGSLTYMAPEQFADFRDPSRVRADTPADVFSLGVILYELLSGTRPFGREPPAYDCTMEELEAYVEWRLRLTDADVVPVPGVDSALQSILRRAMSSDPSLRQPNGQVLMAELTTYLRTGQGAPLVDVAQTMEMRPEELDLPPLPLDGESEYDEDSTEITHPDEASTLVSARPGSLSMLFFASDLESTAVGRPASASGARPKRDLHDRDTAELVDPRSGQTASREVGHADDESASEEWPLLDGFEEEDTTKRWPRG